MAERVSMNVSLTRELAAFVKARVLSGRYQSDSEVVRQGLRLLEEYEAGLEELRRHMAVGVEQLDRREGIDGELVLEELRKLSSSRGRRSK
jgi:antitoxin ParD1/3/4